MIVIVDYKMGNVGSILNMLKYLDIKACISSDKNVIKKSKKLILPGIGSFDKAFDNIHKLGLHNILEHKAKVDKVPILGICLGMQILTNGSEEGIKKGFGWIDAETIKFKSNLDYKVPHMGWNRVSKSNKNKLTDDLNHDTKFYFVHSYYVRVKNEENSILKTDYSVKFDAAINKDNIYGVQFHPEKSHKHGMKILNNFSSFKC